MNGFYVPQIKRLMEDTLKAIGLYSPEVVVLLLRTAAQESYMGHFMRQLNKGPAVGFLQMEPRTFYDHLDFLKKRKRDLFLKIIKECAIDESTELHPDMMEFNLKLAICMARVHYLRCPGKIPNDFEGQWLYYKKYYNSYLGAAKYEEFKKVSEEYKL